MKSAVQVCVCVFVALAFPSHASAAEELKQVAAISIPGEKLTSWDISFIDQTSQRYFLADQSNRAVDIFDTKENKFVGRVSGFVGAVIENGKPNRNKSGPDGVLAFADEAWAGDGDSTFKVIDLKTMKITDTISTGGSARVDEMALDPKDEVVIGVNNADDPPFATLVSTKPDHKVLAKIVFSDATDGAEQPAYNPADGMFYVAIPEIGKDPKKGGVAVVDPKTGKIVKMLLHEVCHPNGLAFGPDQDFVLGCSAAGKDGMPPVILIMNAKTGATVAAIAEIGGADMVAYSAKNSQYYVGGSHMPGGGMLGVIDVATSKLVQRLPAPGAITPHSLAVDDNTGHVFVPSNAEGGGCNCIEVFAPQ
jgi:DNA-binding beta-propeller fold protein YncE